MTDKPIIFSAPMVQALIAGRKTQTRRRLKGMLIPAERAVKVHQDGHVLVSYDKRTWSSVGTTHAVGTRLWVRENHRLTDCECTEACRGPGHVWYEATCEGYENARHNRLRPSIHMPRWASRLTLVVTEVRVQRLHDIAEDDAAAEGVCTFAESRDETAWGSSPATRAGLVNVMYGSHVKAFSHLWEMINGQDSWIENPWVVAISFRLDRVNVDSLAIERVWA